MSYTRKMNEYVIYMDTERGAVDDRNAPIMQIAMIWVKTDTNEIVQQWESPLLVPANPIISEPGQKHLDKVIRTCKSALPTEHIVRTFLMLARGPEDRQPPEIRGWNFVVYPEDEKDRKKVDNDEFNTIIHQFGLEDEWIGSWKGKKRVKDVAIGKAWNYWKDAPKDTRKLCNVAFSLGIDVDKARLHSPLYDCILTAQVDAALDALKENDKPIPELKDVYTGEPVSGESAYIVKMRTPTLQQKEFDVGGKQESTNPSPTNTDTLEFLSSHENQPKFKRGVGASKGEKKNAIMDECAGRTLDQTQIDFLIRETNNGKLVLNCIRCKDEYGNPVRMAIREFGNTPKTDPDHFFFGCSNYHTEGCKISCNMDGTKQTDHHFDPKYAEHRKIIFKYLDDHQTEYEAFKAASEATKGS